MGKKTKQSQRQSKPSQKWFDPKHQSPVLKNLSFLAWFICILSGITLSLKSLREPDLWWIFRTGEWIVQNFQVPRVDQFSYTMAGEEWVNVKWGFEVIAYWFQGIGGPSFVYFFQAIVTTGCLLLLYRIFQQLKIPLFPDETKYPNAAFVIGVITGLMAWEFRINGRPEMVSHFMVLAFTFFLINYRQKPHKSVFWLILLQVVWTNFHEAYGTGLIMLGVFTVTLWSDYILLKVKWGITNLQKPTWLTIVMVLAILSVAINPRGWEMIFHPWNIYQQLGANKYTTELFAFTHPNYWQYQAYLNLIFLAVTLISLFIRYPGNRGKNHRWYLRPLINFGSGYILFLGMFFYLSLTAYRNIPFFILVSLPVASTGLHAIARWIGQKSEIYKRNLFGISFSSAVVLVLISLTFFMAIPSNAYYEAFNRNDQYGLQVNAVKNPVGVSRFIQKHDIKGRCFSGYLTSSYLMWHFRPDFKTFIDLRDLDVFPEAFFNRFAQMTEYPRVFQEADSLYGFDYAVVHRLNFPKLHQHLMKSQEFKPVFADPVAVLYLKDNKNNQSVIKRLGYQDGERDIFHRTEPVKASMPATVINHLFWPPFEFAQYETINFPALAADFYREIGNLELSYQRAKKAMEHPENPGKGYAAMGNLYSLYAQNAKAKNQQQQYYRQAYQYLKQAVKKGLETADIKTSLGALNLQFGNLDKAENTLMSALDIDPGNKRAYQYLAKIYQRKARQNSQKEEMYLKQRLKYLEKAYRLVPDSRQILLSLGMGYCEINQCESAKSYLKAAKEKNLKLKGKTRSSFKECWRKCIQ